MEFYSKLVRDKIPGIIADQGKSPVTHVADHSEYLSRLKDKLSEEVAEFAASESAEELADILEVIHAIREYKNIDPADLERIRLKKAEEKGAFKARIVLDEIR